MKRGLMLGSVLLIAACRGPTTERAPKPVIAPPAPVVAEIVDESPSPLPPPAPPPPAVVERLAVPGDLTASIVHGTTAKPPLTVFIGGICSNANAYLQSFPQAAQKQGGVVAIEGDQL